MIPAAWSKHGPAAVSLVAGPLELERTAHAETRRRLAAAVATIERLRDEVAANRARTPSAWETTVRRQSAMLDDLQQAQLARDVEMAEHLNKHVCTPREHPYPPPPGPVAATPALTVPVVTP